MTIFRVNEKPPIWQKGNSVITGKCKGYKKIRQTEFIMCFDNLSQKKKDQIFYLLGQDFRLIGDALKLK